MSAFLGPIHFWLYDKIIFQEKLIEFIADSAKNDGLDENGIFGDRFVSKDKRSLEELIDESNIHGWLQSRIADAESRYAGLIHEIIGKENGKDILKKYVDQFGKNNQINPDLSAMDIYQEFDNKLLNGMPCDRVNVIVSQDIDSVTYEQTCDIHAKYFEDAKVSPAIYDELRIVLMNSMMDDTKYFVQNMGGSYTIALK